MKGPELSVAAFLGPSVGRRSADCDSGQQRLVGRTARGRVLGIDAGERRVGVALSDELRLLASPLVVLDRGRGLAPVLDALAELARREGVARMVVGLPLNADGSAGPQARRARDFARVASRVIGVPVELWDERLSTREAEAIVRAQGRNTRRARQRGQLDAVAAAVILQDYLDHSPEGTRSERSWPAAEGSPGVSGAPTAVGRFSPDEPLADVAQRPSRQTPAGGAQDGSPPGQ